MVQKWSIAGQHNGSGFLSNIMLPWQTFVRFTTDILLFANVLLWESLDFMLSRGKIFVKCTKVCQLAVVVIYTKRSMEMGQIKREEGKCWTSEPTWFTERSMECYVLDIDLWTDMIYWNINGVLCFRYWPLNRHDLLKDQWNAMFWILIDFSSAAPDAGQRSSHHSGRWEYFPGWDLGS